MKLLNQAVKKGFSDERALLQEKLEVAKANISTLQKEIQTIQTELKVLADAEAAIRKMIAKPRKQRGRPASSKKVDKGAE